MPFVGCNKATINLGNPNLIRLAVIETEFNKAGNAFHIMIEDEFNHFSLIRFIQDFKELDKLLKHHFHKHYIPLPKLKDRSSKKGLFSFTKKKSNATLLESYLSQCLSSKISSTSLFHDFLSTQRIQDRVISKPSVAQLVERHQLKRKRLGSSCSFHQQKKLAPNHIYAERHDSGLTLSIKPKPCETIEDYQLIKVLGRGATGKVILSRNHQSQKLYALKAMTKSWSMTQREVDHIRRERKILSTLSSIHHPFLIRLHSAFQDTHNLYLVMDYHAGADLATLLQRHIRFPPAQCRLYAAEMFLGLQELHRQCILYRDLKPENVLIASDGHLILTDFGLSKMFDSSDTDHRTMTFCGTPEYLAPEIILHQDEYSYEADYWSFGVMLYEMMTGILPFAADHLEDMYNRVLYDDLVFPDAFDPDATDLLTGLLERDPYYRMGDHDLQTHPYFTRHLDWKDVYDKRIEPMFVPTVSTEDVDLTHFDPEFLNMSIDVNEEGQRYWTAENRPAGLAKHAFQGYSFMDFDDCASYHSELSFYDDNSLIEEKVFSKRLPNIQNMNIGNAHSVKICL